MTTQELLKQFDAIAAIPHKDGVLLKLCFDVVAQYQGAAGSGISRV